MRRKLHGLTPPGIFRALTSTQDGAVEQKEQKEVKYIVPLFLVRMQEIIGFIGAAEGMGNER
ncbi:MAG: hypothetical protein J6R18_07760 [Kiritimatiellae bacterium]|nr:hypothetical protein [Kiritimatiellia bacterium]